MRPYCVLLHRYVGLATAVFLAVAGLTGAVLVWYHELDALLNPHWLRTAPPTSTAQPLDPLVLRERVAQAYPGARVNHVLLHREPGTSASFHLTAPPGGKDAAPPENEVFVDPYRGKILGARRWGALSHGIHNLLPFLYQLHFALALDDLGLLLMGVVAVLWTADCFIGAWLTFPAPARGSNRPQRSWWQRWRLAWQVRRTGGAYKLNHDLHRAGGLWLWGMLLVLALSSVSFNLPQLYQPVMRTLLGMQADAPPSPRPAPAASAPVMNWTTARATGEQHMARLAKAEGLTVLRAESLQFDPSAATFRYRVRSNRDVGTRAPRTDVVFDATSGELLFSFVPTGKAAGDTVTAWLTSLHTADLWGLPFRLFITLTGLIVSTLSATGIYLWWKKRAARIAAIRGRRPGAPVR
ncbi:PepSY-associated TM helix domain-containing protein [Azoarcus olearius]|uniref:Conserved hypothetical membrane protein n=1 Tax=Azoarcus sp. (strain BH72) TaxID=418699 RepID=A1K838_AZOSB|nr:PepSY-associated TM helix domain-containing protein [Azoarcus olearius]CAL94993.1 conserved hypothetical membrane protein [Azoarcus olearius]